MTNKTIPVALIGGGGFAREVGGYLAAVFPGREVCVIDFDPCCEVVRYAPSVRYLGKSIDEVEHPEMFEYLVTVASPSRRESITRELQSRNLRLVKLVHPASVVALDARIADGCIVAPGAVINAGASLECGAIVNVHCSVGHGAVVGEFSVLSPFCSLCGDATVGKRCFLGTRTTLFPRIKLGDDCVVDSHTAVKMSVGDRKMVSHRPKLHVLDHRLAPPTHE